MCITFLGYISVLSLFSGIHFSCIPALPFDSPVHVMVVTWTCVIFLTCTLWPWWSTALGFCLAVVPWVQVVSLICTPRITRVTGPRDAIYPLLCNNSFICCKTSIFYYKYRAFYEAFILQQLCYYNAMVIIIMPSPPGHYNNVALVDIGISVM